MYLWKCKLSKFAHDMWHYKSSKLAYDMWHYEVNQASISISLL